MELSPHPNDIRVRSLHMSVPWQVVIPIVKDAFLTEVVIRDVRTWFFHVQDSILESVFESMYTDGQQPVSQHLFQVIP